MSAIIDINANVVVHVGEETFRCFCPGRQIKLPDGRHVCLSPLAGTVGIGKSLPEALKNLREKSEGFFGTFEIEECPV